VRCPRERNHSQNLGVKRDEARNPNAPRSYPAKISAKPKPINLAHYVADRFDLFHDGGGFYWFLNKGVWVPCHDNGIGQIMGMVMGRHAKKAAIQDALKLLEYHAFTPPDRLRPESNLINLRNGMLDIETVELKPHDQYYYSRIQLPIEYDATARCPRWIKCLDEWFPDDPKKKKAVQEFLGYCLYNGIFIHKCLFLIGHGANGKSVLTNVFVSIIGLENVSLLGLHQLGDKFLLGSLKDKLLNVSTEIATNCKVADEMFKKLVAGDLIQADVKYKNPVTFYPVAKHVFSMNSVPVITDRTFAF